MRAINTLSAYVLPLAATAFLSAVAHADDPTLFGRGGNASKGFRHGTHAQEAIVRYPEPHWTSRIGTGAAGAFPRVVNAGEAALAGPYAQQKALRYPEAHWNNRIGTGGVSR